MAVAAISTVGFALKYCVETTAGTRPTTGYTTIPEVKDIPAIGSDVNALDCTPLSAAFRHYVKGVKDTGGALGITVNDAPAFRTAWSALMTAYGTAVTGSKDVWFEVAFPTAYGMDSMYFTGEPVALGFGGASVDAVAENTANIMITNDPVWATASTSGT